MLHPNVFKTGNNIRGMKKFIGKNTGISVGLAKQLLGIGILALLIVVIIRKCFFITSDQAFINTKLVTLRAPITGIMNFSELNIGTPVKMRQSILEVFNPRFGNTESNSQYNTLQNIIDNVENEIAQNKLYIQRYEVDYKRFFSLKEVGAVAKRDFEEIENTLNVLKTTSENKKKQLAHLQQRFEDIGRQLELQKSSNVTAPCNGVVWAVLAKDGEHVDTGDELIQLVNLNDVWVDAFFSERFAAMLRPGMRVTVSAIGSKDKCDGEIVFIRGGTGRVMYNTAVEIPPMALTRRLIAVRVKVDWHNQFAASEFYGVGRSMVVSYNRYQFWQY